MTSRKLLLSATLGLVLAVPASAAAAPNKDRCMVSPTGGGSFNTFVFLDVPHLQAGQAVAVQGVFFTGAQKLAPFHGTIVTAPDGLRLLVGLFVHSTALSLNDFTVSGVVDQTLGGTVNFDNDGDFKPNGTLTVSEVDCATITIPWQSLVS